MSDLTDEEIEHWRSVKAGREMFGIELDHAQRHLMRAIDELQRHRSALAADRERVRSVVYDVALDALRWHKGDPLDRADAIASRAAEQLATAGVGLSDVDRVRLRSVRELLDKQPDVWDLEANLIDRIIGVSK